MMLIALPACSNRSAPLIAIMIARLVLTRCRPQQRAYHRKKMVRTETESGRKLYTCREGVHISNDILLLGALGFCVPHDKVASGEVDAIGAGEQGHELLLLAAVVQH